MNLQLKILKFKMYNCRSILNIIDNVIIIVKIKFKKKKAILKKNK